MSIRCRRRRHDPSHAGDVDRALGRSIYDKRRHPEGHRGLCRRVLYYRYTSEVLACRRRGAAGIWRQRLFPRISGRAGVSGRPHYAHLRRHKRDQPAHYPYAIAQAGIRDWGFGASRQFRPGRDCEKRLECARRRTLAARGREAARAGAAQRSRGCSWGRRERRAGSARRYRGRDHRHLCGGKRDRADGEKLRVARTDAAGVALDATVLATEPTA